MGDYTLEELLAVGGMARVYIGVDKKLDRKAAVKVLELTQDWVDDTIIQRFEREAKAVAALEHSNIITIYQYGQQEGAYYLAMQYIKGEDLRQSLRGYIRAGRKMPVDRAIHIMKQVADALDFAHKAGIIHRDIKPSNILLTPDDRAILTDFGLVLTNTDKTMGTAFGTPRYIAPEQAVASQQAVAQSDIYSLAVIMYEMLTGGTPFDGDAPMEIALAHVSEIPERPSEREPSVPAAADDVLMQALSKDPNDRYPTARAFVDAVESAYINDDHTNALNINQPAPPAPPPAADYTNASKPTSKGVNPIVWVLLLLLLLGGGAFAAFQMGLIGGGESNNHAELVLRYDSTNMVMQNTGDYDMVETVKLTFVRGEPDADADDYSGDIIGNDTIPAGECFRISTQGQEQLLPPQCNDKYENAGVQLLSNQERYFWRTEPVELATFEVRWENRAIARCDTIRRGEVGECRLNYPLPPPETDEE